jgi:hypothetical protein
MTCAAASAQTAPAGQGGRTTQEDPAAIAKTTKIDAFAIKQKASSDTDAAEGEAAARYKSSNNLKQMGLAATPEPEQGSNGQAAGKRTHTPIP